MIILRINHLWCKSNYHTPTSCFCRIFLTSWLLLTGEAKVPTKYGLSLFVEYLLQAKMYESFTKNITSYKKRKKEENISGRLPRDQLLWEHLPIRCQPPKKPWIMWKDVCKNTYHAHGKAWWWQHLASGSFFSARTQALAKIEGIKCSCNLHISLYRVQLCAH